MRDEVREGRSLRAAVERGWTRARRTILVSDTVSFLAAALLYIFAVGDVKGFAFTLGLTTLIDVVVVFLFTKPMVTLLARTKFFGQGHKLSGLDPARLGARSPWRGIAPPEAHPASDGRCGQHRDRDAGPDQPEGGVMSRLGNLGGRLYRGEVSVDFVGRRKLLYMVSGLILVISIVAAAGPRAELQRGLQGRLALPVLRGADAPPRPSSSRSSRRSTPGPNPTATGDPVRRARRRVAGPDRAGLASPGQQGPGRAGQQGFRTSRDNAVSRTFVGPTWGSQISQKALEGLIAFLIAIVIYLSIAFEWKMAAAALVALAHDIVITIGVYALTGFQVSPATVIGLLTILGYSLYDTVVVFDKVRENTAGLLGTRKSTYSDGGQPGPEPDPGPVHQHLADRPAAGGGDPGRQRHAARQRRAQGPVAGAVRRHAVRHLLLDLHRHAGAGRPQGARAAVQAAGRARSRCARPAAARERARPARPRSASRRRVRRRGGIAGPAAPRSLDAERGRAGDRRRPDDLTGLDAQDAEDDGTQAPGDAAEPVTAGRPAGPVRAQRRPGGSGPAGPAPAAAGRGSAAKRRPAGKKKRR